MASTIVEARGRDAAVAAMVEGAPRTVAWGAVIGGAFVIAALSLILLALGAGFGLSSVSPWPGVGASLTTFTVGMAVWLIIVQWLSSALGGYVAGRLGAAVTGIHADEAYFRDTAHGLLAWAVAAVVSAALLASAATALLGGGAAAQGASDKSAGPTAYYADELYRTGKPDAAPVNADLRAEAGRILATDIAAGKVPDADKAYLAGSVAARTGISAEDARRRVDATVDQARHAADATRKAAMRLALFAGFSMLIGAFIAGVAAKIGGHHRDRLAAL
jgi:hypothetical protein